MILKMLIFTLSLHLKISHTWNKKCKQIIKAAFNDDDDDVLLGASANLVFPPTFNEPTLK